MRLADLIDFPCSKCRTTLTIVGILQVCFACFELSARSLKQGSHAVLKVLNFKIGFQDLKIY